MRNSKVKRVLIIVLKCVALILIIASIGAGIVWANIEASKSVCSGISVDIVNADSVTFLSEKGILGELKTRNIEIEGKLKSQINTEKIESIYNDLDYLESAECAFMNDNRLNISVQQLIPVMRVFDSKGNTYYANATGKRMKTDVRYHIDVPVFIGDFSEKQLPLSKFIPLAEYISRHSDLSQYVTAVEVRDMHNVLLYPNIRGHVINFGSPDDFDSKFAKIRKMYGEVIPVKGWWHYDTISVKWKGQIVASRRNKSLPKAVEYVPQEDEVAPDVESISIGINPEVAKKQQATTSAKNDSAKNVKTKKNNKKTT